MRRRAFVLLLVVLAAPMLAGCLRNAPAQETADVTVMRYLFDPGTNSSLNVTKGQLVVLHLTSKDVTHGFAITEYGINVEVPPGQIVEVKFLADKPGDFQIYCTVFCGTGHPQHKGVLHVA